MSATRTSRMLVIGLDCLEPSLAFDRYLDTMPTVAALLGRSTFGRLRSCDPPITVPAWMAMATGRSPGELGIYGFRHRRPRSYADGWTANASSFDTPTVWDRLADSGRRTCLVGFPPSYPPRPIDGWRIGCFLTPGPGSEFAYPAGLADEVLSVAPDYEFDVHFRTEERARLLDELHAMTEAHFDVVEHLLETKPWDLFWFVEIGTDRVHHAFWKFCDPEHPLYEPGNPFETAIRDYYAHVDRRLARVVELAGDDAAVLLVSDHGAKAMRGAFAMNDWLAANGLLRLASRPEPGTPLHKCDVDWSRTTAWAWGGYYARVFLNVEGREPQGVVPAARYDDACEELREAIAAIPGPDGERLDTRVFRPSELYRDCRGDAPDLMVYLDDLSWRSAGTLGWPQPYLRHNDTGPDDAVHAAEGCFALALPNGDGTSRRRDVSIYDVAPTLLSFFGEPIPDAMQGTPCL